MDGIFVRQENSAPFTWAHQGQTDAVLRALQPGAYTLTAQVLDMQDISHTFEKNIRVLESMPPDTIPPAITLIGSSPITVFQGDSYMDAGATASDNRDTSVDIITSGAVDTNIAGTYNIMYTATDAANNSSTVTRIVIVEPLEITGDPVRGKMAFENNNCTGCHQSDLQLNTLSVLNGITPEIIANAIQNVPLMSSFSTLLDQPRTLADLAAYIDSEYQISVIQPEQEIGRLLLPNVVDNMILEGADLAVEFKSDLDIANVRLFLNGIFIRQENSAPYTWAHQGQTDAVLRALQPGAYTLTAQVLDMQDISYTFEKNIRVLESMPPDTESMPQDTIPPAITLIGSSPITVLQGDSYIDAGATASDNRDTSVDIITSGAVDTNIAGTYNIMYTATDAANNSSTVTRIVIVEPLEITGDPVRGKMAFENNNCTGCHQSDLQLNTLSVLNGITPEIIANAIQNVPLMSSFSTLLDQPRTLADLAAYIDSEYQISVMNDVANGLIRNDSQCEGETLEPLDGLTRRLTKYEYTHVIKDTFDIDVAPHIDLLPLETSPNGFTNEALSLIVRLDHVNAYDALSEIVVDAVSDWYDFVNQWTSCTNHSSQCYNPFIDNLGLRLFRSPVIEKERQSLRGIFQQAANEGESYLDSAKWVVRAMLQSPRFLYRIEKQNNQIRDLDGFEMASRLSFLIWSSLPDQILLEAAENNRLNSQEQILSQAERMLNDPKARRATQKLFDEWFNLANVRYVTRSSQDHPEFDADLKEDMYQESHTYLEQVIWENNAPLTSIYTHGNTYVSHELAEFYELDAAVGTLSAQQDIYDLTGRNDRYGLLTQGAITSVSGGNSASLVHRGLFVLNRVMCVEVAQPPANLDTTPPTTRLGSSERDHSLARLENGSCSSCHSQFDNLGWAFEQYDAAGKWRTQDEADNPLTNSGWYDEADGSNSRFFYDNAREFVNSVAESNMTQDCLIIRPTQYAFGQPLDLNDDNQACTLTDIKNRLSDPQASYQDIIRSIVTSSAFRRISAN